MSTDKKEPLGPALLLPFNTALKALQSPAIKHTVSILIYAGIDRINF